MYCGCFHELMFTFSIFVICAGFFKDYLLLCEMTMKLFLEISTLKLVKKRIYRNTEIRAGGSMQKEHEEEVGAERPARGGRTKPRFDKPK